MIEEVTYRRYGLSLDARIDTRNASDPDCRDPEVDTVEIIDFDELMETVCGDETLWNSFMDWLQTPAIAKDFGEWVDQTFSHQLLEEACEEP